MRSCASDARPGSAGSTTPISMRQSQQRLDDELEMIGGLGYAPYFLTVADVVDLIRDMSVRVAARGSGAGSLVNYLLGISGVDPLRYGLLMERFLSPLRQALPDIDIDVESARRTEVYEQILDRYTGTRCACVSMMDSYRVRHAIRDVGAALGMPMGEIDSIAKAFPHIRAKDARTALRELPELRASGLGEERLDVLFGLVERLDGLPRHIAVHPCGVLLSDATLLDRTPVEASYLGFPMSQFDKDDVEDLGLLKLDVLGIRMQSAMAHAADEIKRVDGSRGRCRRRGPGAARRPGHVRADPECQDAWGASRSSHPGNASWSASSHRRPSRTSSSTSRCSGPGRSRATWSIPSCGRGRAGPRPSTSIPSLEPVLRQTWGVVVFHEQVIEMIAVLTGCTLAEADEARRALGDREGKQQIKTWFFPRVLGRGYYRADRTTMLGGARSVCLLRFLQGTCCGVRAADLPVGLAEDPPHGGLPGRGPHPRPRHVSQAADPRRRPPVRNRGAPARRQRLRRRLSSRKGRHPRRATAGGDGSSTA